MEHKTRSSRQLRGTRILVALLSLSITACGGAGDEAAVARPGVVVLALPGQGEPRVDLTRARAIELAITLASRPNVPWHGIVRSSRGRTVWEGQILPADDRVTLELPADALAADEYEMLLRQDAPEPAVFSFIVDRH
jgi:hypothetical protein